jgi:glycosyltransferase involved in cell wall biosynthesis
LYLTPVVPAVTGNGLAMRAGMVLRSLAANYTVSVLAVRLYPPFQNALPEPLAGFCRRVEILSAPQRQSPWTFWKKDPFRQACDRLRGIEFDTIHVFRLAMLRFAAALPPRTARRRHLDLDDVESLTRARISSLCRLNGDELRAAFEADAAARSRSRELQVCREFDRVYVCSEEDRRRLLESGPRAEIAVLPNAVCVPKEVPPRGAGGTFSFLFTGTLGYYPNEDAVRYLGEQIVPCIRRSARRPFHVRIVGTGADERIHAWARTAGLIVEGEVPDMAPFYAGCDAVVVPVRAGGGTRIKILEAWSYRRPVVTTAVGIEGLAARPNEHALVGDTPEEFAAHCVALMDDPGAGDRLCANAYQVLTASYTPDVIARTIAALEESRSR